MLNSSRLPRHQSANLQFRSKLPSGFTLAQAVTLPNNFVTVFHAVVTDLGFPLPWPVPTNPTSKHTDSPILIWGGSSSVGQYALQILKEYGYTNLLATASPAHHASLKQLGARHVFDYRSSAVTEKILAIAPKVPFVFDCIGSKEGSLAAIARIASRGTKVAILLPVIVRDASESTEPVYSMDVQNEASWAEGVEVRGVRTREYMEVCALRLSRSSLLLSCFHSHVCIHKGDLLWSRQG